MMETVLKDLRLGARALIRQPGTALLSVVILGLGIGLSTVIFSLVYGVFMRGLDVPDADRIAVLQRVDMRAEAGNGSAVPALDYLDFRDRLASFSALAAWNDGTVNLADDIGPVRYSGVWATANAFDVLGVQPVLGRTFLPGEDAPGVAPMVLLGHDVWTERYGSDPAVLGRAVRINGGQGTIVGVMPEGFRWPTDHDVWITLNVDMRADAEAGARRYPVIGRLADGASWERAEAEVAQVAEQIAAERADENHEGMSARLLTVAQEQNGEEIALVFAAMMVAALCVLLVACANVANILLGRAGLRTREAGVRVALGAGRWRVMAPFLAESLALACGGALLGIVLAYFGVRAFDQATATPLTGRPYFMVFTVDLPVLLYVLGVTVLTAVAAGVAPALQVARADVQGILQDEARGSSGLRMGRVTTALVVVEVALSVALLVGAGLMTKSIVQLGRFDLPFDDEGILTGRAGLFEADYPDAERRRGYWEELERRVAALPGVASVALASSVPGTGAGGTRVRIEGQTYAEPQDRPLSHVEVVSPGYFDVLGASLLEGEGFHAGQTPDTDPVAVVNASFAAEFWPGESPLGRRFRTGTEDTIPWLRVIGVAPDLQMQGFQPPGSPGSNPVGYYVPTTQVDRSFLVVVARAARAEAETLAPGLREAARAVDPDVPLFEVRDIPTSILRRAWFYKVFGSVFIVFGCVALFMASAGLYGVLAFSVGRRTREMGIRMALGAEPGQVTGMVLRQGMRQMAVGLVLGLVLAGLFSSVVSFLMFQVDPHDPAVFGGVLATILAVGLLASLIPARRATRVDPIVALRTE